MNVSTAVFCGCLLVSGPGCAGPGRPLGEVASAINATLQIGPTVVEPGDLLDVRFARKAEWNQLLRVRIDGHVSMPATGDVRVAGRTLPELEQLLGARYEALLIDAGLTVNFGEPAATTADAANGVLVVGEVARPGAVAPMSERLTLLEALGRAGGPLKATAELADTLLLRRSGVTGTYTAWRVDARVAQWAGAEPIYLQRHDIVYVPNTAIDDIDTWVDQYINRMLPLGATTFALGVVVGNR